MFPRVSVPSTISRVVFVRDLIPLLRRHYEVGGYACAETFPYQIKPMDRILGDVRLADFKWEDVERYKETRVEEDMTLGAINRELDYLSRGLNLAVEARLIDDRRVPKIRRFRLDNARQGFVYPDEFMRIWIHLTSILQDVAMFAYWTGWRKGEVLRLTWDLVQSDMAYIRDNKSRENKPAPLVGHLREVIDRRRVQRIDGCDLVFHHRRGKRIVNFSRSWATAVSRSGLSRNITFHDLRRSFVNNARQAGIDRSLIMKMTGHRTHLVFDRYNIVDESELRTAALRIMAVDADHR